MDQEWLEAEGEVELEMASAFKSNKAKRIKQLRKWRFLTFLLLFLCYIGVYVCGGCFTVASPQMEETLQYTSEQVSLKH